MQKYQLEDLTASYRLCCPIRDYHLERLELHIRSSFVITKIIWHQRWRLRTLVARKHGISEVQVIFAMKITVLMFPVELGSTVLFLLYHLWLLICFMWKDQKLYLFFRNTISIILIYGM